MTGAVGSADELENQKAEYDKAAEQARQAAEAIQLRIDSVSALKRTLDEEAAVAVADYESKQNALNETLNRIAENEKKLAEVQAEYQMKHKILEKRVRDIYINGQISYLDVLFGAQDFGDFLTRADLLKRVMLHDSDLVNSLLAEKNEIDEIGKNLSEDKEEQEVLAQRAEYAKNVRLEKVSVQQQLIDRMKTDKEVFDRQYDEMTAASEEISEMIERNKYQAAGYVTGSGSMMWPVTGEITSPFGWRTHPIFGRQIYHSGLDIAAEYGTPIVAAQSGIVIHSGWIDGYGNTVMIDHGGGIVSLYGHNQSLAVDEGQTVNKGQIISYCGSTGNSTGPHCHFEVRRNGEPVSPYDYL